MIQLIHELSLSLKSQVSAPRLLGLVWIVMDVFGSRSSRRMTRRVQSSDDNELTSGCEALRRILRLEGRFGTFVEKFQWVEFEDRLKRLERLFLLVDFQKLETAIDSRMVLGENHDLLDHALFPDLKEAAEESLCDGFPELPPFDDYVFGGKKMDVGEVMGSISDECGIAEVDGSVFDGRVYLFGKLADVEESVDTLVDKQDGDVFPARVGGLVKKGDVKEIFHAFIFDENEDIEEVMDDFDEQKFGEIDSGVFDGRVDIFTKKANIGKIEGSLVDEQDDEVFGNNDDIGQVVDILDENEHGEVDCDDVADQVGVIDKTEDVVDISEEEFVDNSDAQNIAGVDIGELERMIRRLFQEHSESLER